MPKLRDIATVRSGLAPPPVPTERASCAYAQIADLDPTRRRLVHAGAPTAGRATPIEAGDILVAARGERTTVARPDGGLLGAYPGLDLYLVRPDPQRLDADYLAAFLTSQQGDGLLRGVRAGSALPRLPIDALAGLDVPLPPLARQRLIGQLATCLREQASLLEQRRDAQARLSAAQLSCVFDCGVSR